MQYVDRYVPANTNSGWGIGAFIVLLAVACIVMATYVHKRTYKHPTDVSWHSKGIKEHRGAGTDSLGPNAAARRQGTAP